MMTKLTFSALRLEYLISPYIGKSCLFMHQVGGKKFIYMHFISICEIDVHNHRKYDSAV
jgi:hypothetical protein